MRYLRYRRAPEKVYNLKDELQYLKAEASSIMNECQKLELKVVKADEDWQTLIAILISIPKRI